MKIRNAGRLADRDVFVIENGPNGGRDEVPGTQPAIDSENGLRTLIDNVRAAGFCNRIFVLNWPINPTRLADDPEVTALMVDWEPLGFPNSSPANSRSWLWDWNFSDNNVQCQPPPNAGQRDPWRATESRRGNIHRPRGLQPRVGSRNAGQVCGPRVPGLPVPGGMPWGATAVTDFGLDAAHLIDNYKIFDGWRGTTPPCRSRSPIRRRRRRSTPTAGPSTPLATSRPGNAVSPDQAGSVYVGGMGQGQHRWNPAQPRGVLRLRGRSGDLRLPEKVADREPQAAAGRAGTSPQLRVSADDGYSVTPPMSGVKARNPAIRDQIRPLHRTLRPDR